MCLLFLNELVMLKHHVIPVTSFFQNCSIIWCSERQEAAIVDPGGNPSKLISFINEQQLTVTKVILTHGHLDHVGATHDIASAFNVPIEGPHIDDDFWIENLEQQAKMFGLETPSPFTPTLWLNDGDTVTVGNEILEVHHCPGHTPGHVMFFSAAQKLAWVGDVIFSGSIGRTDFPKGNHQQLVDSICKKLWPLGDDVEFICGHGPNSTFGQERRSNPLVGDKVTGLSNA